MCDNSNKLDIYSHRGIFVHFSKFLKDVYIQQGSKRNVFFETSIARGLAPLSKLVSN